LLTPCIERYSSKSCQSIITKKIKIPFKKKKLHGSFVEQYYLRKTTLKNAIDMEIKKCDLCNHVEAIKYLFSYCKFARSV
jgi:hypothetical protein